MPRVRQPKSVSQETRTAVLEKHPPGATERAYEAMVARAEAAVAVVEPATAKLPQLPAVSMMTALTPLDRERKSVIRTFRLRCSNCGRTSEAACDCGVAYVPAAKYIAQVIAEHPELENKSNRAVAAQIGVSYETVRQTRNKSTDKKLSVRKTEGRDGKKRKATRAAKLTKPAGDVYEKVTNLPQEAKPVAPVHRHLRDEQLDTFGAAMAAISNARKQIAAMDAKFFSLNQLDDALDELHSAQNDMGALITALIEVKAARAAGHKAVVH